MNDTKKILIIRFSSLGDIVLTTSFVQTIKKKYSCSEIYFLTKKRFNSLLNFFPCPVSPIFLEDFNSLKTLANSLDQFDLIFDLHSNLRTFVLNFFTPKKIFRYKKKHFYRLWKIWTHSKKIDFHTIDLYHSVLKEKIVPPQPKLSLKSFSRKETGKKKVLIHPGASRATKQWPVEYFIELTENLVKKYKYEICFIGGPAEKNVLTRFQNHFKQDIDVMGPDISIKELILTINQFDLLVSNDSGPAHIAAALNISQITIFGATHPSLGFAPVSKNATIIQKNLKCSPCTLHGSENCPKKHFQCMQLIKPGIVYDKIIDVLGPELV